MDDLIARLRAQLDSLRNQPAQNLVNAASERSLNQVGGVVEFIIDLNSEISFAGDTWSKNIKGYGVIFAEEGSTPGVRVNVAFGSQPNIPFRAFRVGDSYVGAFDQITFRRAIDAAKYNSVGEQDPIRGTLRILVLTTPVANYQSLRSIDRNDAVIQDIRVGNAAWSESTAKQATDQGSGSYPPSSIYCGKLDINGARGCRFTIEMPIGTSGIGAGGFFLWWLPPQGQSWIPVYPNYKTSGAQPDPAAAGVMVGPSWGLSMYSIWSPGTLSLATVDIPIFCGLGHYYIETVIDSSSGLDSADLTITGYAWR